MVLFDCEHSALRPWLEGIHCEIEARRGISGLEEGGGGEVESKQPTASVIYV